jgi:4-hydroxybenzoyl-CoA reductase subunit beta
MRRLPRFEYHAPATVEDAVSLLAEHGEEARPVAGGTDILISMKQRLTTPRRLIGLSSIAGMDSMEYDERTGLRVGAGITLTELTESTLIKEKYPALSRTARMVGSIQVRNLATLGGNLCLDTRCWYYNQSQYWRQSRPPCYKTGGEVCHVVKGSSAKRRCFAVYSGDTAPLLMALDAQVKLMGSDGERVAPLSGIFTGDGACPLALEPDELITEVLIPPPAEGSGAAYVKLRLREEVDFPILGAAAAVTMTDGTCSGVRVVLNAVAPSPLEVMGADEMLAGSDAHGEAVEEVAQAARKLARPVANTAGTPDYRRRMVPLLVKRALREAVEEAGAG